MGEIEAYLEARAAFVDADKAVDGFRERFFKIVKTLSEENRSTAWIHGVNFDLPAGAQATRNSPNAVQQSDFPTAQQYADTLMKWHQARKAVLDHYAMIPERFRSQVQILPDRAALRKNRA
jgi:hypothetical protein